MSNTRRLELTPREWVRSGGRQSFTFQHALVGEPLLRLEALANLAERLEPAQIEIASAASELVVDERITTRLDAAASRGDVVRHAEADRRWMSMRNIETDSHYRELVEDCLADFRTAAAVARTDAYRAEGYVFIGSSRAVTPAHVDHEHNLFFQIRGTKRFVTGGFPDAEQRARTFEGMYHGEYGSTAFPPAEEEVHVLSPGNALYVSPQTVHMVENSAEGLAISFSVVFHDRVLDREAKVYAFNARLRGLGIRPRPPGPRVPIDRLKATAVDGWQQARQRVARLREIVVRQPTSHAGQARVKADGALDDERAQRSQGRR